MAFRRSPVRSWSGPPSLASFGLVGPDQAQAGRRRLRLALPARSWSGPPSFARPAGELRMASHPTKSRVAPHTSEHTDTGEGWCPPQRPRVRLPPRRWTVESISVVAWQHLRTTWFRVNAANVTSVCNSRTPAVFPAGFRCARSCTGSPHARGQALRLHPQQHVRFCSVLHRRHLERASATRGTQPRWLSAHEPLDAVARRRRGGVCR